MPRKKKDKKDKAWSKSEAKELLAQDIIDGVIPEDMHWTDVFFYRPEYALSDYGRFRDRLKSLRSQISDARVRASRDEEALAHDRKLFPVPAQNYRREPRWEGSAAESWLRIDVSEGKHKEQKPQILHVSRPAYLEFPLDAFRTHIYQEERFQKYCNWRSDTDKRKATKWK